MNVKLQIDTVGSGGSTISKIEGEIEFSESDWRKFAMILFTQAAHSRDRFTPQLGVSLASDLYDTLRDKIKAGMPFKKKVEVQSEAKS